MSIPKGKSEMGSKNEPAENTGPEQGQTPAEKRRSIHAIAKVHKGIMESIERHDALTKESTVAELLETLNRDVMKEAQR